MSALLLGDIASDFEVEITDGHWAILFSHPADFTPVCTTELGMTAKLKDEFEKREVKVFGLSVDPIEDHRAWIGDIEETQGVALNFPLIADPSKEVATAYGMIYPNVDNTATVRSLFVIGPDKKIKLKIEYPASTGRNFNEVLRVVDSLQLTAQHKVATPANWAHGKDVIIVPTVSDEDAKKAFPDGFRTLKPYLRMVAQPAG
ncbi:peroxiredoxin [Breoghania sp.]|uniref:peroxiredoxin n=1 Tax=Breoghania sp. TaxID=2065378 RepID=UPI0026078490|nr:peroxiredoxin [Breoghania sp.]MDJ0932842.1 peroxiredoxin [Breoghania sp.]